MSHGYAYRCDHCGKSEINAGIPMMPRPPEGWIVVAVVAEPGTPATEREYCSLPCLLGSGPQLEDDGAWM